MQGRIFKFRLDKAPINGDMGHFLHNIVMNRDRHQIILSKGRVASMSIDENDYIFIQSNGYFTHYMRCREKGPVGINDIDISVKDITTLNRPIKSIYKRKRKTYVHTLFSQKNA